MSWLKAVKLVLTPDCEHAMRIVSEGMDRDLSRGERAALRRIHDRVVDDSRAQP